MSYFKFKITKRCAYAPGMAYPSDLTDEQWELLEPLTCAGPASGPKHGTDLRLVVDAMMYVTQTGCQWRYLPGEFGPWTRVWSQFRRWSRNGTWATVLAELHRQARLQAGRPEDLPSALSCAACRAARDGSWWTRTWPRRLRGGVTFHDQGDPYGRTNGAKRVVAIDVTGLPLPGVVVPASTSENTCVELVLEQLHAMGQGTRLELVLVDRGVSARLSRCFAVATADGTLVDAYEGVNALRTTQRQLRRANRPDLRAWPQRSSAHARTKPGSHGRATAKLRLQKLHAHVARQRRWLAHQITTELVRDCRHLVVEDLNVADMGRLRTLARALADAGLGDLRRILEYKAAWYGTELVVADRWFASSKTCSGCGHKKDTLLLSERTYRCEACGLETDRDLNAAINLARWPDQHAGAHDPPLPAAA